MSFLNEFRVLIYNIYTHTLASSQSLFCCNFDNFVKSSLLCWYYTYNFSDSYAQDNMVVRIYVITN